MINKSHKNALAKLLFINPSLYDWVDLGKSQKDIKSLAFFGDALSDSQLLLLSDGTWKLIKK